MSKLVFQTQPTVILGGCTFIRTLIILQHEDTPLIEVVRAEGAGYATQIPIYDQDGLYIAKVVGSRLVKGPDAHAARIKLRQLDKQRFVSWMERRSSRSLAKMQRHSRGMRSSTLRMGPS